MKVKKNSLSRVSIDVDSLKKLEEETRQEQQSIALEIANAPVDMVCWKADRRMTSYPLFAPDKRNRHDVFEYVSPDKQYRIKVLPHAELGRAKVWDADVFTYFLSRAYDAYRHTSQIPFKIETTAYQVLKSLGKNPEDTRAICWLRDAIRRLSGTSYQSNIFGGINGSREKGFNLLNYEFIETKRNKRSVISKIIIEFSPELIECWLSDIKHILSLPNGVLELSIKEQRSGLRKRLLLLIGTRLGNQNRGIRFSLENFKGLCGYTGENRRFKSVLKEIIPTLPWRVEFQKSTKRRGENIVISHKKSPLEAITSS